MSKVESMTKDTSGTSELSAFSNMDIAAYGKKVVSFLARNFFTMKYIALGIAFIINLMLLFYKVKFCDAFSAHAKFFG